MDNDKITGDFDDDGGGGGDDNDDDADADDGGCFGGDEVGGCPAWVLGAASALLRSGSLRERPSSLDVCCCG